MTRRPTVGRALAGVALAVGALVATPAPSGAGAGPSARGPAPTAASVTAPRGPLAFRQTTVTGSTALGFDRATISYPVDGTATYGGIVAIPGFVASEAWIAWTGPFLASNGFVVMTLEPFSAFDGRRSRASQLDAALGYLVRRSPPAVRSRLDPRRLGAIGHSTGGGGALDLASSARQPDLKAIVALQPWSITDDDLDVGVPSMEVGVADDLIAPPATNAEALYEQIAAPTDKAYTEISSGGHLVGAGFDTEQARATLVWMKRWVDGDTRYTPFICPGPAVAGDVAEYRSTCPM